MYLFNITATAAPRVATFGQGTGEILLDNLMCVGTEATLFDCPHNGVGIDNCAHSEDAGAVCAGSSCKDNFTITVMYYTLIRFIFQQHVLMETFDWWVVW